MEASVQDPPGTHPEDLNGAGPDEPEQTLAPELIIEGDGQLSMNVGGKRATTASLRLVGGKIKVDGQYAKGSELEINLTCAVTEVAFVDERDSNTGQVVGCSRRHKARITGASVVPVLEQS